MTLFIDVATSAIKYNNSDYRFETCVISFYLMSASRSRVQTFSSYTHTEYILALVHTRGYTPD